MPRTLSDLGRFLGHLKRLVRQEHQRCASFEPEWAISEATKISMLGDEALHRLSQLAGECGGPVIELGPYIGGSTIALAAGAREKVVTVELGGPNLNHPDLPSHDIIQDLRDNLRRTGLATKVAVVEGHFRSEHSFIEVREVLGRKKAMLLFIDVHPGTEVALQIYGRLLGPNAFVIVDDYKSDIATEKAASVRRFVETAVSTGALTEIGVFGWGTWFGRLSGGEGFGELLALPGPVPCVRESGYCWHMYVGHEAVADDKIGNRSPLVLMEDDRELGLAHILHDEIRAAGGGRYSHWAGYLWFSTSDNSDPRSNGRRYSICVGGNAMDLASPTTFSETSWTE